ncbi:MAG: hypothetical protein IJ131_06500, partial [Eggerthellaceae bacterium]|nr:hypothetical protein [Eggerthellaceae bacterium]
MLTVLVTVGVLTNPAISVSGSPEELAEQGIALDDGNTVEIIDGQALPAASESAQGTARELDATRAKYVDATAVLDEANVAMPLTEETVVEEIVAEDADAAAAAAAAQIAGENGTLTYSAKAEEALKTVDLSSARLIVGMDESKASSMESEQHVVASHDNVYLLQYASADEASQGFLRYYDVAEFVAPDVALEIAEGEEGEQPADQAVPAEDGQEEGEQPAEGEAAEGDQPAAAPVLPEGIFETESGQLVNELGEPVVTEEVVVPEKVEDDPEEQTVTTDNVFTEEANPFTELESALDEEIADQTKAAAESNQVALIALIDTGIAGKAEDNANVVEAISVLGEEFADENGNPLPSYLDENGHGQRMADYIVEENADARILAIKALGKDGKGDVSAVIAGINYAIERGASIINLSAVAYASEENAALAAAVKAAEEAGVAVVGAAGNQGFNAKYYIPANIDEALVVGAANEVGVRLAKSNFGETVDYNVVAESTSEAAARTTGFVSVYGEQGIADTLNQGKFFQVDFVPQVIELVEPEAEPESEGEEGEATDESEGEESEAAEDTEGEQPTESEEPEEAPEDFEGIEVQETENKTGKQSDDLPQDVRNKLVAQRTGTNGADGAFTETTVNTWDALEWAVNNCASGKPVTIKLGANLAAYKTITIPAGKNIKIVAGTGTTVYRDSSPASGMASFFNVEGELDISNVELSGQAVSSTISWTETTTGGTPIYDNAGLAVSAGTVHTDSTSQSAQVAGQYVKKVDNGFQLVN